MTAAPITVLGNVSVDRVDGGPPRAGGCPTFAAPLLARTGGSVVTRCAAADRALFDHALAGCRARIVDAASTTAFEIANDCDGHGRSMSVTCTGDAWRLHDLDGIALERWVHVAPLLAGDVGVDVLAALRARGHRIAYDGQGLVRARALGPLRESPPVDPGLVAWIDVLKLSDGEAALLGAPFDAGAVRALGVPEVVVTHGARGVIVHAGSSTYAIEPLRAVAAADPTGAGDAFMVGYVGARAAGAGAPEAAALAADAVVRMLEARAPA